MFCRMFTLEIELNARFHEKRLLFVSFGYPKFFISYFVDLFRISENWTLKVF